MYEFELGSGKCGLLGGLAGPRGVEESQAEDTGAIPSNKQDRFSVRSLLGVEDGLVVEI